MMRIRTERFSLSIFLFFVDVSLSGRPYSSYGRSNLPFKLIPFFDEALLRLRGGESWHVRVSQETIDAVENSSIVRDWCAQFENYTLPENATEEDEEIERPFIQMDTLMFMLKLHRDRMTDASGQLVADNVTEAFLPNKTDVDERAKQPLAVWVNKKMNTRCMLLRGECMGIGGKTLAEYVAERGNFTDDEDDSSEGDKVGARPAPTAHSRVDPLPPRPADAGAPPPAAAG